VVTVANVSNADAVPGRKVEVCAFNVAVAATEYMDWVQDVTNQTASMENML